MENENYKQIDPEGEKVLGLDGSLYYKFGCEYLMPDGKEWSFYIWAKDWEEADLRIKMIKDTVRNGGQIIESIPL